MFGLILSKFFIMQAHFKTNAYPLHVNCDRWPLDVIAT